MRGFCSHVVIAAAATAVFFSWLCGCGILSSTGTQNPLWGVWSGPYSSSLGTQADSSRFAFTSKRVYLFFALKADGTILAREFGYYSSNGYLMILSSDPGGNLDREEIFYEFVGESLVATIRGQRVVYRRVGGVEWADDLGSAAHLKEGAVGR
ncbi:MAG TPA: hypothetical protein PLM66_06405 [Candidatus Latescibacteria bacterium]|nr:hypothetical protein [Candidatus Latescibacterota bacterium]